MKDIKDLNISDIYVMMQNKTIDLQTLSMYISTILPSKGLEKEELKKFLDSVNEYVDDVAKKQNQENDAKKNEEVIQQNVNDKINQENVSGNNQLPISDNENEKKNSHEEAIATMRATSRYCQDRGMKVKDLSYDGKSGKGPYISFEINHESKQMLDHLMSDFYQNSDGVSMELKRSAVTKDEMLTIEVDPKDMKKEDFDEHIKKTFEHVKQTIETTKKDYDYEEKMPDGLKNLKQRFRNDDPDIGNDFTIGYVRNDGKDSYYIVADNYLDAVEYAKSIGYDIKNTQGVNVFEVETYGSTTDTKLANASVDLASDETMRSIKDTGVSELDIYAGLDTDPKVEMIQNFIETGNDPHIMCMVEIEIPKDNPSQRIVSLKSSGSSNEVVVFPNGDDFDRNVLPKIVDTYAENNKIKEDDVTINDTILPNAYSCHIESENNTSLYLEGYSEGEATQIANNIESKSQAQEEAENVKSAQKTLGEMPTQTNDSVSAFISMPVLIIICVLFLLLITLVVFSV